jgi:excisionase family DNA binding protein
MEIEPEILRVKEVSELLKIHESTVYKMIREGRTPVFMIGAEWRFLKDQIVHWMAEQTIRAVQTSEAGPSQFDLEPLPSRPQPNPYARGREWVNWAPAKS